MDKQVDTYDIDDRLKFIGLDARALADLQAVQAEVDKHLPLALDAFYEHIATVPAVAQFFSGPGQMASANGKQVDHWKRIAMGRFDQTYMEASRRIGLRHADIGLEPRWYIGGYGRIVDGLIGGILRDSVAALPRRTSIWGRQTIAAEDVDALGEKLAVSLASLMKAALIDVDIAVSVYFDKVSADAAARDRVNADRIEWAAELTGEVLQRVAGGDLTETITADLDGGFARIKDDVNRLVTQFSEVIGKLRRTSRQLRSATSEILAGANDLNERTVRQAATIEETSASIEQLADVVRTNAAEAETAAAHAKSAARTAEESGDVMGLATQAMDKIRSSSERISSIIGMIDQIAFQTNLLALNASVEAARAGEAGKGFAVVAVEVRRLAQSAAGASAEVKQLIDQSNTEISEGARFVAGVADKLTELLDAVQQTESAMERIAEAGRAQAHSIAEINTAVRQMDEITQHNAALVEETSAAIEQTEAQALGLDRIVDVFTVSEEDGEPAQPAEPPRAARPARQANAANAARRHLAAGGGADWTEF